MAYYKIWVRRIQSEEGNYVDSNGVRYFTEWCSTMLTPDGSTPADHGYERYSNMEEAVQAWGLVPYVNPEIVMEGNWVENSSEMVIDIPAEALQTGPSKELPEES